MRMITSAVTAAAIVFPFGAFDSSLLTSTEPIAAVVRSLDYRYFVAGGTCAAISHGITTPIDVVKTRIQANPVKYNKGLAQTALSIIKDEGSNSLLSGLGPTLVGYGVEGAAKFGVYEICKPLFRSLLTPSTTNYNDGSNNAIAFLMASITAGAIAALILCPMDSSRIRIVTDPASAGLGGFNRQRNMILDNELWRSSFSGLWAMLAKQVPYTFGKQVSFDLFTGLLYSYLSIMAYEDDIKLYVSLVAAVVASFVACILSQPGDMILTETYSSTTSPQRNAFSEIVHDMYQQGGLLTFFTGLEARVVHVGAIVTTQLVIYDFAKQMLGLPATGSN